MNGKHAGPFSSNPQIANGVPVARVAVRSAEESAKTLKNFHGAGTAIVHFKVCGKRGHLEVRRVAHVNENRFRQHAVASFIYIGNREIAAHARLRPNEKDELSRAGRAFPLSEGPNNSL